MRSRFPNGSRRGLDLPPLRGLGGAAALSIPLLALRAPSEPAAPPKECSGPDTKRRPAEGNADPREVPRTQIVVPPRRLIHARRAGRLRRRLVLVLIRRLIFVLVRRLVGFRL